MREALGSNAAGRVDLVLLDDGRLVTRSDILFVGADSTSRVGAKIFDLADVPALSFDIAQDNSLELLGLFRGSSSLTLRLHEGVFRHEEVVASLLSSDSLA